MIREVWPALPLSEWQDTCITLGRWLQIAGKVRLKLAPMQNHYWQATFYVTSRGLTSSPIPYEKMTFSIDFDFIAHQIWFSTSEGGHASLPLRACNVAECYRDIMSALASLGIDVKIWPVPVELPDQLRFDQDFEHSAYDAEYVTRFWRILVQTDQVMKRYAAGFLGKQSPVHFFWGASDLAVTRFSGRRAPAHPGVPNVGKHVMVEAYSHEVSSAGFWAGLGLGEPAFYAYSYPEPPGYSSYPLLPSAAYYHNDIHEFILPYEAVRRADSPDEMLLEFLRSTYEAAAETGKWDRAALERQG